MKYDILARGTTKTEGIKEKIQMQFDKFDKYLPEDTLMRVTVSVKDNGNRHKVEVTIPLGKSVVHAEENASDLYAAIDNVEEKLDRILRKRKEKTIDAKRKPKIEVNESSEELMDVAEIYSDYKISRSKTHELIPMTPVEACSEMEMVDHPFYLFQNSETDSPSVVYKREDGTYGLIGIK